MFGGLAKEFCGQQPPPNIGRWIVRDDDDPVGRMVQCPRGRDPVIGELNKNIGTEEEEEGQDIAGQIFASLPPERDGLLDDE